MKEENEVVAASPAPAKTPEQIQEEKLQEERKFFMVMHEASGLQICDKCLLMLKVPDMYMG
jgi:hypothetical protein